MTVKELIKELQMCNENAEVTVYADDLAEKFCITSVEDFSDEDGDEDGDEVILSIF